MTEMELDENIQPNINENEIKEASHGIVFVSLNI